LQRETPYCHQCGSQTVETVVYNREAYEFTPDEGTRRDVSHGLSRTEAEVVTLLAEGFTNSEIAARLSTTEQAVKYHLAQIYPRIGVRNRVQAVAWWRQITGEEA
jgi:DNA-binding NarL/FixJ family response regulator